MLTPILADVSLCDIPSADGRWQIARRKDVPRWSSQCKHERLVRGAVRSWTRPEAMLTGHKDPGEIMRRTTVVAGLSTSHLG